MEYYLYKTYICNDEQDLCPNQWISAVVIKWSSQIDKTKRHQMFFISKNPLKTIHKELTNTFEKFLFLINLQNHD